MIVVAGRVAAIESALRAISTKKPGTFSGTGLLYFGRRGGIRTRDPLHPMQVRYQAALHAEASDYNLCAGSSTACGTELSE